MQRLHSTRASQPAVEALTDRGRRLGRPSPPAWTGGLWAIKRPQRGSGAVAVRRSRRSTATDNTPVQRLSMLWFAPELKAKRSRLDCAPAPALWNGGLSLPGHAKTRVALGMARA